MFVQNDFFDEDDDNKLQMNSSPYTNIQKPTTVQSNSFGQRSYQKEFDVNGDTLYSNSRRDDAGDVNQLQPKENTRKKQTITFKSRGTASIGQSTQKEDSWKPDIPTASRTDSQKARPTFNDDMEFADLDDNKADKTPFKSNAGWDAPMESNRVDQYTSSRDQQVERPVSGYSNSGIQRGVLQTKQRFSDQNRMQFSGTVQANDAFSNRNQGGPTYGYTKLEESKDGINYNELQKYAYDGKKEFYDPSMNKSNKGATFSLSKMSQNIKYERNEDYIPPTRDDIKVKEEAAPLYREEKAVEPDEDSDREEEPNEDDTQAQRRAEELERKQFEEREAAKKLHAQREAKVEMIAKPQSVNEDSTPTESSTDRELRILNPEYLDTVDMKAFLTRPAPKGYLIQCNIKREKAGFGMYPKYHVTLSNGFRYLLSGKKEAGSGCSSYIISMNAKEFSLKSKSYIGRARSNFIGTEFNIWDTGLKPAKTKNIDQLREQLAVVLYERNILGSKGPRKMHVLLPDVKPNGEIYQFKPLAPKEGMLMNYQNKRFEGFKEYYNKPPRWNEQYQAFVLNFNGRVEKPSVKNFQLVHESNEDMIMLQFGRVNKDTFTMDFQWPMSPLQAFGICLTSFDYKLACE